MKYVDDIIKFLSNEMNGDEESYFRQQIENNVELDKEFKQISDIWYNLKEYLTLEKSEENISKEELIAELIAEHDILSNNCDYESLKTKKFRSNLQSIVDKKDTKIKGRYRRLHLLSGACAAAIALLIMIQQPWNNSNDLLESFYIPEKEAALHENIIHTRADSVTAMDLFSKKAYLDAMLLFEVELIKTPEDKLLKICYALSCYENGLFEKSEAILIEIATDQSNDYSNISAWYLSLIYAKENHLEKSKDWLIKVKERKCQYSRNAAKLLKKL